MPTYTVHEPPQKPGSNPSDPERFVFVRDGFSWWAFLLAPFWMLINRMWLVLFGYIVVNVALSVVLSLAGATGALRSLAMMVFALLVGFEAATLRRFTLRKWKTAGLVVADSEEEAERRFFVEWVERGDAPAAPAAKAPPPSSAFRPTPSQVLGLFPEPGAPR